MRGSSSRGKDEGLHSCKYVQYGKYGVHTPYMTHDVLPFHHPTVEIAMAKIPIE